MVCFFEKLLLLLLEIVRIYLVFFIKGFEIANHLFTILFETTTICDVFCQFKIRVLF